MFRTMARRKKRRVSRRDVLIGLGASVGTVALGCGGDDESTDQTKTGGAGGTDSGTGGGAGSGGGSAGTSAGGAGGSAGSGGGSAGSDAGSDAGATCSGGTTLSPSQLLAGIETIVVLCMENRSFDHYLGSLSLLEGLTVDGLTGSETNPDPNGTPVPIFNLLDFTPADPPHGWGACHAQFNNGANDGFVTEHAGPSQNDVMGYHVRSQIPIIYALADAGAICDRYFCSVLGPTWPNRFYLHGASSNGNQSNTPAIGFQSLWPLLDDAGVSNKNYFHDLPWCAGGFLKLSGTSGISTFFSDAAAGTLPNFSIIDPQFFGAGANDDHPDHDIQLGQLLIATIYQALAQGPQWSKCLFVVTYDEHGGFYDHVPPPTTDDQRPEFQQMGFRVPTLVTGPFVKKGCVVSTVLEHSSVLKTLMVKYNLPSLNQRVDAANDLSSVIQPAYLNDPQPPVALPQLSINRSRILSRPTAMNHHPELWQAAQRRIIPRHLDRRSKGIGETEHVLRWAQRLGVARVT
jgi:phospholipase C